jgi:hypothetical protein
MLLADVFITTKGRYDLFTSSLASFMNCTDPSLYRLTIVDDTGDGIHKGIVPGLRFGRHHVDHVLIHSENMGLGPSINQALAHIDSLNRWHSDPEVGDKGQVAPFICYVQDDILYTPRWLNKLASMFLAYEDQFRLGFASGIECVEHPMRKSLGNGLILKDYVRAANMFGRREYWMSMFPIPQFDVETRSRRAKPNDGMGSGVDWHFIRDHENSVCRTGRTNLVIPGLLQHMGYDRSTWLKQNLPESEKDLSVISALREQESDLKLF